MTSKHPGYEKAYWQHVTKCTTTFSSWKQFDSLKAWKHVLDSYGQWELFKNWCSKHVDFLHSQFENSAAIIVLHALNVVVVGIMKRFCSKAEIGLEIRLAVPETRSRQASVHSESQANAMQSSSRHVVTQPVLIRLGMQALEHGSSGSISSRVRGRLRVHGFAWPSVVSFS